ncbi:MAG: histone deacetylase [candidate division WOR-3 bacterium]|nr:histone deacetylase [candidate division WOR-3 bacterium]MCX7948252.1 histone deacetylase [candidate division WOR-3 bacterium]MDW8151229.1 histone deacetylase [candidate division WOR-3 bacterium]
MKWFVYSNKYVVDFGNHPFRTTKYRGVYEKLVKEGTLREDEVLEPDMITLDELLIVHTREYIEDLRNLRITKRTAYSEIPLNKEILELFLLACNGTYKASLLALENGYAFHCGGGFHHAYEDHAEGFCYLNDIAYAIRKINLKTLVIDLDVHQGNGTAHIFRSDSNVFTFSMHQEWLYPIPKEKSSLDIGLEENIDDEEYLKILIDALDNIFKKFSPEFIIYVAGADVYYDDMLANLSLTIEGIKKRDEIVIKSAYERKIPIVVVLAGGYSRKFEDLVKIHSNTAKVLKEVFL